VSNPILHRCELQELVSLNTSIDITAHVLHAIRLVLQASHLNIGIRLGSNKQQRSPTTYGLILLERYGRDAELIELLKDRDSGCVGRRQAIDYVLWGQVDRRTTKL
jgi:hypothetical protein